MLDDTDFTAVTARSLRERVRGRPIAVRTWRQLVPLYGFLRGVYWMTIAVLGGIVGTFALLATANVMLGAVTERTREIGLLRAVGMQPRTVWSLFLLEGCLLGLVGGLCGAALSFLVGQWVINSAGLSFPPPPGGASAVPVRIDFALGLVTWSVLLIVLVATASGGVAA